MKKVAKYAKGIFGSLMASVITTLVIMAFSFLSMLFSSAEDGYRTTLFNTIFFNSATDADGVVNITFGLTENYAPLVAIIVILFAFFSLTYVIYTYLTAYKEALIHERKSNK